MDLTDEILTNKEKYPDDAEITLSTGDKITVKQFRDNLQPRAAFTRASQEWSREREELQRGYNEAQRQLAEALKERREAPAAEPARTSSAPVTMDELASDPVLGPLVRELREAKTALTKQEETIKQHEKTWLRDRYLGQIDQIERHHNATFKDKPFDKKAFLDFAISKGQSDLGVAYRDYTYEDAQAIAEKRGEERGVEKGKKAAAVPVIPGGRRRAPARPEGVAEGTTFSELSEETIANDPEIAAAMRGEEP